MHAEDTGTKHTDELRTPSGVGAKQVFMIGMALLVSGLAFVAVILVGYGYFEQVRYRKTYEHNLSVSNPDLVDLRRIEDMTLTSYGWVDAGEGKVRIPIERAMELVVQEGVRRETR